MMSKSGEKKYMNIPMEKELYNRANCRKMACEIAGDEKITGMSIGQLSCEIFAHAYIYYNFKLVPKFLREVKVFKSFYHSVADGVDLEDDGDKLFRRIAYRVIWFLPAF